MLSTTGAWFDSRLRPNLVGSFSHSFEGIWSPHCYQVATIRPFTEEKIRTTPRRFELLRVSRNRTCYQHSVCKIWSDPESNLVPALSLQNTGGPGIELGTSSQIAEMLKVCFDSSPLVFTMIPTKYGRTRNRTWYQHSVCKIRMEER